MRIVEVKRLKRVLDKNRVAATRSIDSTSKGAQGARTEQSSSQTKAERPDTDFKPKF
ncbi:hypothetical protein [Spirosoma endophyticum]|uniref:Uncharacterized protein n=1 Tax=Spirosoma endophyticum TaxID=662367 RepID=A0A1I2G3V5_9BACT|nr:hypothetical protein [Spirosoma endophyticum]SFF11650.1 hypothetical protein SAMN05216167_12935 [Spirosoma endophyticum]